VILVVHGFMGFTGFRGFRAVIGRVDIRDVVRGRWRGSEDASPYAVVYRIALDTVRPPSDFTAHVVPFHPEARVPLENPLIAWQR